MRQAVLRLHFAPNRTPLCLLPTHVLLCSLDDLLAMTKFYEHTDEISLNRVSTSDSPDEDRYRIKMDVTSSWKYRRFFGLPHYASPQVQLLLVAFVCFLCPGTCKKPFWLSKTY